MGYEVELLQTDIAPQYQGLATGSIDIMLMSWQPGTHEDYIKKVGTKVVNLGLLYTHARLGWVVPGYIPESDLKSIEDLKKPEVREKLDGTITGIDPGAGLTRLSEKAIEDYGLDYALQVSSGAGMTAALERAVRRKEWIVVTGWSPHWMFGAYDLRYLDDPKGVLGQLRARPCASRAWASIRTTSRRPASSPACRCRSTICRRPCTTPRRPPTRRPSPDTSRTIQSGWTTGSPASCEPSRAASGSGCQAISRVAAIRWIRWPRY